MRSAQVYTRRSSAQNANDLVRLNGLRHQQGGWGALWALNAGSAILDPAAAKIVHVM